MQQSPSPNRCPLCGAKTRGDYCHAHDWAAGEPKPAPRPLELVAGPSTGSGRRLIRKTA